MACANSLTTGYSGRLALDLAIYRRKTANS